MSKAVWCFAHQRNEPRHDRIDFPVSTHWRTHYAGRGLTPGFPQSFDDRYPRERRIDEGVAQAMRNIEAEMNGETLTEVSSPNYEREIEILSARVDYLQVSLAELRQRQRDRDSTKITRKKGFDILPSA